MVSKKLERFKRRIYQSLSARHDRPLGPPTSEESELVGQLKGAFREMSLPKQKAGSSSEEEWLGNVSRLRELVLEQDPREFLRWDVILKTMCIAYASYTAPELDYLKSHPEWKNRWRHAIEESAVGHPLPYWRHPESSENLIHHAYHLAQFEDKTGRRIDAMSFVLEFGAGYGSMCRLIHNLGFKGKYLAFDLPAFSALQRFFLESLSLTVHSSDEFQAASRGITCISDVGLLRKVISDRADKTGSLFVATWSISETPLQLRNSILPFVSSFEAFLIAYQAQFGEVDNVSFFRDWAAARDDVQWHDWRIKQVPNHNRYLIGKRNSAEDKTSTSKPEVEPAKSNS